LLQPSFAFFLLRNETSIWSFRKWIKTTEIFFKIFFSAEENKPIQAWKDMKESKQ